MMLWAITVTSRSNQRTRPHLGQYVFITVQRRCAQSDRTTHRYSGWTLQMDVCLYLTVRHCGFCRSKKSQFFFFLLLQCQVGHLRFVFLKVDVNVDAYLDIDGHRCASLLAVKPKGQTKEPKVHATVSLRCWYNFRKCRSPDQICLVPWRDMGFEFWEPSSLPLTFGGVTPCRNIQVVPLSSSKAVLFCPQTILNISKSGTCVFVDKLHPVWQALLQNLKICDSSESVSVLGDGPPCYMQQLLTGIS